MTVLTATRSPKETIAATIVEPISAQTQVVTTVDDFLWRISVAHYHQMIEAGGIYARAGVPIYWIVNLVKFQIEVYSEPDQHTAEPDYRQRRIYRGADQILIILDGTEVGQIVVSDLLPPQLTNKSEG